MKKLIIIIVLLFSTLFSNVPFASAVELSHKQMSDIYGQGYHNALLETVVEVNAKASTRLEENRDLLTQYYDDTKGYINQRIQDYGNVSNFGELLIEQASGAMTLADSVLDLLSSFFKGEESEVEPVPDSCTLTTGSSTYGWHSAIPSSCPYSIYVKSPSGGNYVSKRLTVGGMGTPPNVWYEAYIVSGGAYVYGYVGEDRYVKPSQPTTLAGLAATISSMYPGKGYIATEPNGTPPNFGTADTRPTFYKNHFNNMKSNPSTIQPVYIPQLQPKLSCPDGDKVVQIDGRGGFVHANGVPVNADGCTVYWQKPIVNVDDDGKVTVTDPDTGETTDTGVKPPKDKIPVEDKGEGCDSVLCFLGAVTSGIADLISSILGIVEEILDALLALFVPDNLDFISGEFDKLSAKFNEKFSLLSGLKDTITGVFQNSDSGNPLSDVNMSLPAAPGFNFNLDTITFIEPFVPRVKQIISGILFLMTIIYVYRKITGRGGVMEK